MTGSDASNVRRLRRPLKNSASAGRRLKVEWPAEIKCGAAKLPCTIIDISSDGAQLLIAGVPPVGRKIWLVLEKAAPIPATAVWQQDGRLGLRFLREQPWLYRLEEKRFDASAWIDSANR